MDKTLKSVHEVVDVFHLCYDFNLNGIRIIQLTQQWQEIENLSH